MHTKQREPLANDLRQNTYTKLEGAELKAHQDLYTSTVNKRLITEWEHMGGSTQVREWPKYPKIDPQTGLQEIHPKTMEPVFEKYQAHHINPQQLGGKHEWWNIHPVHLNAHQGGIHGKSSKLSSIIKELGDR